jgi:ribose 5-phosphate isomerase B
LKEILKGDLQQAGYAVLDLGTNSTASVDYPDFGAAMGEAIASGKVERGVVVCGSGIGISIAANRNPKVRAVLAHDTTSARLSREHNDANVVAFGQRLIGVEVAREALKVFLSTSFEGGRHAGRVAKLSGVSKS